MRRIVATEFMTLDGVFEEPSDWSSPFWSDEALTFKLNEILASDALLIGRLTYEGFAAAWPNYSDEMGFADRMNGIPKYVISTTLDTAEWNNSHIIRDNVIEEIAELKQQPGQDILLAGSGQLVRMLMAHDLIDEYRFMLHPVVVGKGKRLFPEGEGVDTKALTLVKSEPFISGIIILTYEPAPTDAA